MSYYLILASTLFLYVTIWFIVSLIKKRNDVADIAWGFGFVLLAWVAEYLSGFTVRSLLVNLLVTLWGTRLALHIHRRNRGKAEDYRYQAWRKEWKHFVLRSFSKSICCRAFFWTSPAYLFSLSITPLHRRWDG